MSSRIVDRHFYHKIVADFRANHPLLRGMLFNIKSIHNSSFRSTIRNRYTRSINNQIRLIIGGFNGILTDPYSMAMIDAYHKTLKMYGVTLDRKVIRQHFNWHYLNNSYDNVKSLIRDYMFCYKNDRIIDLNKLSVMMHNDYEKIQYDLLMDKTYTNLINGVTETINYIRHKHNMKIGVTTDYNSKMVSRFINNPKIREIIDIDNVVSSNQVMTIGESIRKIMANKSNNITDINQVIKLCNTMKDVYEGFCSNVWTIGIVRYSNKIGSLIENPLLLDKLEKKNGEHFENRYLIKGYDFFDDGKIRPNYVIRDITQLPIVIDDINYRLTYYKNPMRIYKNPIKLI